MRVLWFWTFLIDAMNRNAEPLGYLWPYNLIFFFPPQFLIDFLMQLKILQLSMSCGSNRFIQEVIIGNIDEALLKAKQWITASARLGERSHIPASPTEPATGRKEGRKGLRQLCKPPRRGGANWVCFSDAVLISAFWGMIWEQRSPWSGSETWREPSGGAFVRRRRTGCGQGLETFCWALCVEELRVMLF